MRQGDMPPPVPERVCQSENSRRPSSNSDGMHRATHEDAYTRAWFDYCRSVFPQSVRKAGPNVDLYNVSTYKCSIIFNNIGSFNRKSEFRTVVVTLREMQREVHHIDYSTKSIHLSFTKQLILMFALWLSFHG